MDRTPKVLWIGATAHREVRFQPLNLSRAGERFQLGLAEGLAQSGYRVQMVGQPIARSWPLGPHIWIPRGTRRSVDGLEVSTLGTLNIPYVKQIEASLGVFCRVLSEAALARLSRRSLDVIVYNSVSYLSVPALVVCHLARIPVTGIIADVPLVSQLHSKVAKVSREARMELRLISRFDKLVVLARPTAVDFGTPGQPVLLIEGGVDARTLVLPEPSGFSDITGSPGTRTKTVVFSGSLDEESGIELALAAMNLVQDDECKLQVFGFGPLQSLVESAAGTMKNVEYAGAQPHHVVLEAQRRAALLIAPRLPDSYVTKYTFPSKLLEYLASGTPTLTNKLAGIPREYIKLLAFAPEASPEAWCDLIEEICRDEAGVYGERARYAQKYVGRNKNWTNRGSELASFLLG